MEPKRDRTDFVKFFLRLAEISFLILVATPTGLRFLKAEIGVGTYLVSLGMGVVMILLFLLIAYKIWKG